MALKKKDKEKKENEAKLREKQKKLKEMRLHRAQSTPFVQPTVDQALLAAAIAQAQAMGGAAVNPVFVNPVGTSTGFNLNHLLNPLHMRLRGSVMKQPKFSGHPNYWASFERQIYGLAADGETGQGTLDSRVDGLFDWQTQGKYI